MMFVAVLPLLVPVVLPAPSVSAMVCVLSTRAGLCGAGSESAVFHTYTCMPAPLHLPFVGSAAIRNSAVPQPSSPPACRLVPKEVRVHAMASLHTHSFCVLSSRTHYGLTGTQIPSFLRQTGCYSYQSETFLPIIFS